MPADPLSIYGPIVSRSDVMEELLACLQLWAPEYLWEAERQHGYEPGTLPAPRSWVISAEVEKFPEDQLPAVMLACPAMTDPPTADGEGNYTARWEVAVAVEVSARGNRLALALADLYAAALRTLCLQQQTFRDSTLVLRRVEWMGERYDRLDSIDDRTVCVGQVDLALEVATVTCRNAGPVDPMVPEPEPGPDSPHWPTAETADVQYIKTPLEE